VIVRVDQNNPTIAIDGRREFVSVLETASASGKIIPPFIVWAAKSHIASYYGNADDAEDNATFAISDSGCMDDELGVDYMKLLSNHLPVLQMTKM
jgi:hypothetical protein